MVDTDALLAAYDQHMRVPSVPPGVACERDGRLLRLVGSHVGRIRGPRDVGVTGAELDSLIARQRDYFQSRGEGVEWKVRGHDLPADLGERLMAAGFVPGKPSTVLLGFAEEVAGDPAVPDGVVLRQVSAAEDMRRIADQQTEVWGLDCGWVGGDLTNRVAADPDRIAVLIAEAGDRILCSAWVIYDPSGEFAALLGGTTVPDWRGRGLYRAMLAVRARAAADRGIRLLHVDASADSAPILRHHGFHPITTSVHYQWTPPA